MKIKIGDFVKLKEPEWSKVLGQGERPEGLRIGNHLLKWGEVFEVFEESHLDSNGLYREIGIDFIKAYMQNFEILN